MKGLVFTTFYDFCERRFGIDTLEDAIDASGVPGGGAYTSVGTYPFEQLVAIIVATVKLTGVPLPKMLEEFGEHCFANWVVTMPQHFAGKDLFDVLASIDDFHEKEVRRLYPDAELPSFRVHARTERELLMDYWSCKPLADLATGVIRGAAQHLATPVAISHRAMHGATGPYVQFRITRS